MLARKCVRRWAIPAVKVAVEAGEEWAEEGSAVEVEWAAAADKVRAAR